MTLKAQILGWFLMLSLVTIIIMIPINFYYYTAKEKISNSVNEIDLLTLKLQEQTQLENYFLNYDSKSANYYETGESIYLKELKLKSDSILSKIDNIIQTEAYSKLNINKQLETLKQDLVYNTNSFNKLVNSIFKRGFKDYGIVGDLRNSAHLLENFDDVSKITLLTLRRYEKDYIIRNESDYVYKLNTLTNETIKSIKSNARITNSNKNSIVTLLENYQNSFNKIVQLDSNIGLRNKSGIYSKHVTGKKSIVSDLTIIRKQINQEKGILFNNLKLIYIIAAITLFVISFITSLLLAKRITNPISRLNNAIQVLVKHNFNRRLKFSYSGNQKEIALLGHQFNNMVDQMHHRDSDQKESKKLLQASEKRFKELSNLLPQSVFEINKIGKITYANNAWFNLFFYDKSDLTDGLNIKNIFNKKEFENCLQKTQVSKKDIIAKKKSGKEFVVNVYTSPIVNDGEVIGTRAVVVDISERKQYIDELEKQKTKAVQSDKLKTSFLANMSHEIRTPINAITGFTQLLNESKLNKSQLEYVSYIKIASKNLMGIINDILDISKIEAGHIEIENINLNIRETIANARNVLIHRAKKKNLDFEISIDEKIPKIVIGDPTRLSQILINLSSNALKFTKTGNVHIKASLQSQSKDNCAIVFNVTDTGIGIKKEKLNSVFDRFVQENVSTTREYGGTGLGLSITKSLVELQGGTIKVTSEIGKGSNFEFTIPFKKTEQKTTKSNAKISKLVALNKESKIKVLLVEDDKFNTILATKVLEKLGIESVHAENGKIAVETLKENNDFDLVLMDIQMPVMDGYEATKTIRDILNSNIPIIAMSAHSMNEEKDKCIGLGMNDYISKPFSRVDLFNKIIYYSNLNKEVLKNGTN